MMFFVYLGIAVGVGFIVLTGYVLVKTRRKLSLLILILAIVAGFGLGGLRIVPVATGVVVFYRVTGDMRSVFQGTRLVVPIFEKVDGVYETRIKIYTVSSIPEEGPVKRDDSILLQTRDGTEVPIDATIRYKVPEESRELALLHKEVGPEYVENVVRPEIRNVFRDVGVMYKDIFDLIAGRETVGQNIYNKLKEAFTKYHLVLVDVDLRKIKMPADIQAKVKLVQIKELERQEAVKEAERIDTIEGALERSPFVREIYVQEMMINKVLKENPNITLYFFSGLKPGEFTPIVPLPNPKSESKESSSQETKSEKLEANKESK